MRKFPLINFSLFTSVELCDFVSDRVHHEVKRLLAILHNAIVDKEVELFSADIEPMFSLHLMQFEDKCNMLIRLENLVLFPFIKAQALKDAKGRLSEESINHLIKLQEQTRALTIQLRLSINNYLTKVNYKSQDLIIINDMIALEMLIDDWISLVQYKLMPQLKPLTHHNPQI